MRLIDADAMHAEISKWPDSVMYKDWVQSAIATAPTIPAYGQWISVEERLPERNGKRRCETMEHILSLSYGKDSLACLGAIEELGWPLDRIVHAEVWATDTIPADLPPMVKFKARADKIIKDRWGIEVEHISVTKKGKKWTYEDNFYKRVLPATLEKRLACKNWFNRGISYIYGFPSRKGSWCNKLKFRGSLGWNGAVTYAGIAADEAKRIERWTGKMKMPLVEIGWTEADCRRWCEENGLLSPIYTTAERGGCWFCHNQGVDQLRLLRKNYPDYWALMLKWDADSPISFKADGHTVHDYDRRFALEDMGLVPKTRKFRWSMISEASDDGKSKLD